MRRLLAPGVTGSIAAIIFATGLNGPASAWARAGCGPRSARVTKLTPARSDAARLRLAMRLGTDPRCNVIYVIERPAGSGRAEATADLWDQDGRGRWHLLQHALLFGPYSGARVRLISAHLGDINRDARIELTADFRVRPGSRAFITYTFTSALAQLRPNQPGLRSIGSPHRRAGRVPDQGLYEECAPALGLECDARLGQIAAAGFRVVLNYTAWSGTADQIQAYADEAARLRLKLIWPLVYVSWRSGAGLRAAYPQLAASCSCETDAALRRFAITLVSRDPATWGYYIGDEVSTAEVSAVRSLAGTVRTLAPGLPLLAVFSAMRPGTERTLDTYAPYVDALGEDYYPIGTGLPVSDVGAVVGAVHRISAQHGIASVVVLQAFSWDEYPAESPTSAPRWPTRAEMRMERDQAIARGSPALILWYSFHDVWRSPAAELRWADLVWSASPLQ